MLPPPSVIIGVPKGAPYDDVLSALTKWSAEHLLNPFIWCQIEDLTFTSVDAGVAVSTTLARALDEEGSDVSFTGLLMWSGEFDASQASSFDEQMAAAQEHIRKVVTAAGGASSDQQLLLAPLTVGATTPPSLLGLQRRTLLLAAEDRASPTAPNLLADEPNIFASHTAAGMAAMLGLWVGQDLADAPFLQSDPHFGNNSPSARLCASYTRIADLGFVADNVIARVMDRADGWPNPKPSEFDATERDPQLTDRLTALYLQAHAPTLALTVYEPITVPDDRVSILEAWRRFVRHLWQSLFTKPIQMIEDAYRTAYNRACDATERITGQKVVAWDEDLLPVDAAENHLLERLRPPDGPVQQAWFELRQLCIGMVDGSTVPAFVPEHVYVSNSGRRLLVLDPRAYVPSPHDQPPIPGARPCDPQALDPRCAPEGAELNEETLKLLEGYCFSRRESLAWRVGVSITNAVRRAETEAAKARKDVEAAQEQERKEREAGNPAEKRFRRGVRRLAIAAAVVALAAIGGFVAAILTLKLVVALLIGAALMPAWFFIVVLLAIRSYRARKKLEHDSKARILARINAAALAGIRTGDVERLNRRYEEYLDWAEALSWWLHEPWTPQPLRTDSSSDRLTLGLPPSVQRRVARIAADSLEAMVASGGKAVFPVKWLDAIAKQTVDEAGVAYLRIEEADVDPGAIAPNPFGDTREGHRTPRGYVLRTLRDPTSRVDRGRQAVGRVEQDLCDWPILANVQDVVEDTGTDGLQMPTPGWSAVPDDLQDAVQRLSPSVVRIMRGDVGGSGVVLGAGNLIITNAHVVDYSTGRPVEVWLPGEAEARQGTVVAVSEITDLASVRLDDPPPTMPGIELAPRSPAQGAPVVTLGFPKLLEGDPTLAWGLVAARHRSIALEGRPGHTWTISVLQCTYPAARGASGSGVFDEQGRLVGVNCARRIREDEEEAYMSFAVPVEEVRAFLDGAGTIGEPPPMAVGAADSSEVPSTDLQTFVSAISVDIGDNLFLSQQLRNANVGCKVDQVGGVAALDLAEVNLEARARRPSLLLRTVTVLSEPVPVEGLAGP